MNRHLIRQARGDEPADLVLKGGKVINVFTKTIEVEDIAISDGIILGTGIYQGKREIDCSGLYISPGFIDGHVHIESSMLTPTGYAPLVMPWGTTSIIADCHEIANVKGIAGIEYMLASAKRTPLDVFMMIPSCVPATSFETAGAELKAEDIAKLKDRDQVLGLGEMMNYPGVIEGDDDVHDKLDAFSDRIIDGHAPSVFGQDLNAYILAGVKTDHECTHAPELIDKVKRGMYIHLREGSQTKNVLDLLPGVKESYLSRLLFCSDDLHPHDILKQGHINHNINLATKAGLDPLSAIQMATINIAQCYRLDRYGAIAPGYFADLVLFKDLKHIKPDVVYKKGTLVAKDGKALFNPEPLLDATVLDSVHFEPNDFDFNFHLKQEIVNVIKLVKNNITTRKFIEEVTLTEDGDVVLTKTPGLLKLFVIERHHQSGRIGKALVRGYGLKNAAIALSIAHDSHNVICISDNEQDALVALRKIKEIKGGIVLASQGRVLDYLKLEVAGLMTNQSASHVKDKLESMDKAARRLGVSDEVDDPFLSLAFLSLPVIPEIKCTDRGLFDVTHFKIIPIEAGRS